MLIIWLLVFCLSIIVLIKAADYFTEAAEKIGLSLKIPPFIVGASIVTFGTTLPELGTAIAALVNNQTSIIAANAIGSNIANILLVAGLAALVAGVLKVKKRIVNVDMPLLVAATALLVMIMWDKTVTWGEGVVAILGYLIYSWYIIHAEKEATHKPEGFLPGEDIPATRKHRYHYQKRERKLMLGLAPTMILSMVLVYFSSVWTVKSIVAIADWLAVPATLVAIIALAIGTSLPELVVAVAAVRRGRYEIALGNVFGANIFNSLVLIGLPSLFRDLTIDKLTFGVGVPFLIGATFLYVFSTLSKKIHRWDGLMYLLIYALFIAKLLGLF